MLSIHLEVQDFDDEDETNYKVNEVNKENMNEFCSFIAHQKSETIKQNLTSKSSASFVERRTRRWK